MVIEDLAPRHPVAKVVSSTNLKSVIPVLEDTYNTCANPERQKSDNGPSFNSTEMLNFTSKHDTTQVKIPPNHPSTSNAETVIKLCH